MWFGKHLPPTRLVGTQLSLSCHKFKKPVVCWGQQCKMDSSDDEEERELQRRRAAQNAQRNGSARKTNLNEALAKALSNGFPADTQSDIIVTAEELKKEEEEKEGTNGSQESSSSKEKAVAMDIAEEKTMETLLQIRSESKVEDEGRAMSRQDDEEIDSDDDMEAYRIQQAMEATDMRALDSSGSSSVDSNFFRYPTLPFYI